MESREAGLIGHFRNEEAASVDIKSSYCFLLNCVYPRAKQQQAKRDRTRIMAATYERGLLHVYTSSGLRFRVGLR